MALKKWPLCADVLLSNHSFIPSSISRYTVKFALELFTGTFYYTFCADGLLIANIFGYFWIFYQIMFFGNKLF